MSHPSPEGFRPSEVITKAEVQKYGEAVELLKHQNALVDRMLFAEESLRQLKGVAEEEAGKKVDKVSSPPPILNESIISRIDSRFLEAATALTDGFVVTEDENKTKKGMNDLSKLVAISSVPGAIGEASYGQEEMFQTEKKPFQNILEKIKIKKSPEKMRKEAREKMRQQAGEQIKKSIVPENLKKLATQFDQLEILLSASSAVQDVLTSDKYTPLQIAAAEKCLLALNRFASKPEGLPATEWSETMMGTPVRIELPHTTLFKAVSDSFKELAEILDISQQIETVQQKAEDLLLELRHRMAKTRAEIKGVVSIAQNASRAKENLPELLSSISQQSHEAEIEYARVEDRLDKLLSDLKNSQDPKNLEAVEGTVLLLNRGNMEEIFLTDFNVAMEKLREFTFKLNHFLNLKEEKNRLPEHEPEKTKNKESKTAPERAEQILGSDYFGPEAAEKTFGVKLEAKDIPAIPFTEAELERAKELGQFLILRVNIAPDGHPLTIKKMNEILEPQYKKTKKAKFLYGGDGWYKDEDFYKTDAPTVGWALVSKENIPNSTSKNYLLQTQELAKYTTDEVFKDAALPPEYQEAIDEWENYYAQNFKNKTDQEVQALLGGNDWQKYAKELASLKSNQLFRLKPVEERYDSATRFNSSKKRPFENCYTWTSAPSSSGGMVYLGCFDAGGAVVYFWKPDRSGAFLGVSFSRSH